MLIGMLSDISPIFLLTIVKLNLKNFLLTYSHTPLINIRAFIFICMIFFKYRFERHSKPFSWLLRNKHNVLKTFLKLKTKFTY